MKYSPKHKQLVHKHLDENIPTVVLDGVRHRTDQIATLMGIKISHTDKYRKDHADLGETLHRGYTDDPGDGVGESQE